MEESLNWIKHYTFLCISVQLLLLHYLVAYLTIRPLMLLKALAQTRQLFQGQLIRSEHFLSKTGAQQNISTNLGCGEAHKDFYGQLCK